MRPVFRFDARQTGAGRMSYVRGVPLRERRAPVQHPFRGGVSPISRRAAPFEIGPAQLPNRQSQFSLVHWDRADVVTPLLHVGLRLGQAWSLDRAKCGWRQQTARPTAPRDPATPFARRRTFRCCRACRWRQRRHRRRQGPGDAILGGRGRNR